MACEVADGLRQAGGSVYVFLQKVSMACEVADGLRLGNSIYQEWFITFQWPVKWPMVCAQAADRCDWWRVLRFNGL